MTLVKYNPLNNFIPGTFADLIENFARESAVTSGSFTPTVDVFKTEKEIELDFYAPGLKKEDFNIDLKENILTISGERTLPEELKERAQKIESNYGPFKRAFKLSNEVDFEKINAAYTDGILKLVLPLVAKKEATVIKVK